MRRLFILVITTAILFSCSKKDEEILIGFSGVLSGRYSELGVYSRNGADLAVDHINKNGGIKGRMLRLVPLDNKNDKQTVTETFDQLIDSGISFIVGPNISHLSEETKKYAQKDNVLFISPTMSTDRMAGIDDSFLRVINVTSQEGEMAAEIALKMGKKKASVVYDISNNEYTQPIYRAFKRAFEKGGGVIVLEDHVSSDIKEDFLEMAKKIHNAGPDMVFVITTAIDAAYIAQQVNKFDNQIQFFAARWAKTIDILTQGGDAVEGMILTAMYTGKVKTAKYLEFTKNYEEKYNTQPSFVSRYAYEAVMVLAEGMKKADRLDAPSVKKAILSIGSFEGLEETIFIDKYGDAQRKSSVAVIKDGKFEVIDD